MATIDRRFIKSEEAIKSSLIKLLQRKKLAEISLNELVDAADINRSTFYLHYQSIEQAFDSLEDLFVTSWQRLSFEEAPTLPERFLAAYKGDRKLGTAIFLNARLELVEKLYGAYQSLSSMYSKRDELSFFALFGSCLSVMGRWIEGKCKIREDKVLSVLEKEI